MHFFWVLSVSAFVLESKAGVAATWKVCPAKP